MTLTREAIRARIDALEALNAVQQASDDVGDVEWMPGDSRAFDLHVNTHDDSPVTFVHNLPPAVLLAGLRAMEAELMRMADVREVEAEVRAEVQA